MAGHGRGTARRDERGAMRQEWRSGSRIAMGSTRELWVGEPNTVGKQSQHAGTKVGVARAGANRAGVSVLCCGTGGGQTNRVEEEERKERRTIFQTGKVPMSLAPSMTPRSMAPS